MFDYSISIDVYTAGWYLIVDIERVEVFRGWFPSQCDAAKEAERILNEERQKRGMIDVESN